MAKTYPSCVHVPGTHACNTVQYNAHLGDTHGTVGIIMITATLGTKGKSIGITMITAPLGTKGKSTRSR